MKLTNTLILCPLILSLQFSAYGHDFKTKPPAAMPSHTKKAIDFVENKGQWNNQARFKADVPGGALFLTDKGFVYNYASAKDLERIHEMSCGTGKGEKDTKDEIVHHHAYKVNFVGASDKVSYTTEEKRSYYHNYFLGNDPSQWAGKVGLYGKVTQKNIYDGVDVVVYSKSAEALKYDFVVAPGSNPASIALAFEGVSPRITKEGNLLIKTSVNEVTEKAPYTYQVIDGRTVTVASRYKLEKGILSFDLPEGYNKAYPLVIDPDLVFATYSGSTGIQSFYSFSTTYDAAGCLYAGTQAYGVGWPVSPGAFQSTFGGSQDAGVNKYSADGLTLIYSTLYGGSDVDLPHAMIVNKDNELIMAGTTTSTNLPVTTGAYDPTHNGGRDIFVAHFNATGSALIGATYIGTASGDANTFTATTLTTGVTGQNNSSPTEVNFDKDGNIWVVSSTPANNFPVTPNAMQATSGGATDGVLFQFNPTCTTLMYSTYLGGSGNDVIFGIQFNSQGNVVVCGATQSANFPTTSGVLHAAAPGGSIDGFVTMVNVTTGAMMRSTYLGTNNTDQAVNLQVDCADNIYVLGRTQGNYPVSPGVYSMANSDLFIDKLSPDLGTSLLSTRVGYAQGGNPQFFPTAFVLDICGNVYVAGLTSSGGSVVPGMPLTPDAFSTIPDNFYFLALESGFTSLLFATYFGLQNWDDHTHVGIHRLDPSGIVYHSICCNGSGWPTAPSNVYCPNKLNSSGQDIVSFKFNFDAVNIDLAEESTQGGLDTNAHCVRGCKSAFVDFIRSGDLSEDLTIKFLISGTAVNGTDYSFIPDSITIPATQTTAILEVKPLLVQYPSGTKEVIIQALSPCGCEDGSNNIVREARILIYDSLFVAINTPLDTVCPNTQITITAEIDTTLNFRWEPAALSQGSLTIKPTPTRTSVYTIIGTQPGAPATCPPRKISYEVFVEPVPVINLIPKELTLCASDSADLNAYAGPSGTNYIYNWSPPDYLKNDYMPNNKFSGPVGDYKKIITVSTPVANCTSKDSMLIHVYPPFSFQYVTADTTILYGDSVQLTCERSAIRWLWTPATYLSDPLLKNPVARPEESMTYHVIGYDINGCHDTASVRINVEYASKTAMPNAFSPNGDGLNDEFKIGNVIFEKLVEFKIWNRLGHLIYDGKDPKKGWDGTIKGQPAAMDTYFYHVQVVMPNGKPRVFKGDVILIR